MAAEDRIPRFDFSISNWFARRVANPEFQSIAARLPFGQRMAKHDGAEIFEILQGFVASQVLSALIELNILSRLLHQPQTAVTLAERDRIPPDRMERLLRAAVALGLLKERRDHRFALARKGAAILGVPGLEEMIRHNRVFYDDLSDPVAFLQAKTETNLQRFWPYVFGASGDIAPEVAERYSNLMAQSQILVAKDTLRMVSFKGISRLLDVGGGAGMFLSHVLCRYSKTHGVVFDLPEVLPAAQTHLGNVGLTDRVTLCPGDFREDPFPDDLDAITLIRVLYDHDDQSVVTLVNKAFNALPAGGKLIISEPMTGGKTPNRAGDVYFALYTMAMGTGKTRSPQEIADICRDAGFARVSMPRAPRPYITSAVVCEKGC